MRTLNMPEANFQTQEPTSLIEVKRSFFHCGFLWFLFRESGTSPSESRLDFIHLDTGLPLNLEAGEKGMAWHGKTVLYTHTNFQELSQDF